MQVFASTLAEKMAQANFPVDQWVAMIQQQFHTQASAYRTKFPKADFDIILVDGEQVGRLYLDRRDDEIRVLDFTLLPAFRAQGIGTKVMEGLFVEARGGSQKITGHVGQDNLRGLAFASRVGFRVLYDTESTSLMIWEPPSNIVV